MLLLQQQRLPGALGRCRENSASRLSKSKRGRWSGAKLREELPRFPSDVAEGAVLAFASPPPPCSVVFTLFFISLFLSQRLSPTIPTCLPREKRIAEGSQPHFHNKFVSSRDDGPPNAAHSEMAEGDEGEVEGGGGVEESAWI